MGAIQKPTPQMGPYGIEARSESFILRRAGKTGDAVGHTGTYDTGQVSLPAAEIPQILAALAQAEPFAAQAQAESPAERAQRAQRDAETEAIIARPWQIAVDGDALRIAGPVWTSVEPREELLLAFVEIPYGRLAELRTALDGLHANA